MLLTPALSPFLHSPTFSLLQVFFLKLHDSDFASPPVHQMSSDLHNMLAPPRTPVPCYPNHLHTKLPINWVLRLSTCLLLLGFDILLLWISTKVKFEMGLDLSDCHTPSQMSPDKLLVFLDVVDIWLSLCMVERVKCKGILKVFLNPCSKILHAVMFVFNVVYLGDQRSFNVGFLSFLLHSDDCRWWNPYIFCNCVLRNFFFFFFLMVRFFILFFYLPT